MAALLPHVAERRRRAVSAALREARENAGVTQSNLARGAGMISQHLCWIEKGQRGVGLQIAWRIADALAIPLADVIERAEEILAAEGLA